MKHTFGQSIILVAAIASPGVLQATSAPRQLDGDHRQQHRDSGDRGVGHGYIPPRGPQPGNRGAPEGQHGRTQPPQQNRAEQNQARQTRDQGNSRQSRQDEGRHVQARQDEQHSFRDQPNHPNAPHVDAARAVERP